jgi:hypothetical protein
MIEPYTPSESTNDAFRQTIYSPETMQKSGSPKRSSRLDFILNRIDRK